MKIHRLLPAGLRMAQRTFPPFDFPLNGSDKFFVRPCFFGIKQGR